MLLAFILCFSTLPMTAFAQEADAVTEQEEQQEAAPAAEPEEQQEADSAEEQKEAEAVAAPGEETSSDKSTTAATPGTEDPTAGEAPDTVKSTGESISDNDAGTQDTAADDEKKAAVQKVQALIDALPETVTMENAESVSAQLEAIDEAMESLTEEQIAELDMTRLHAVSEAMNAPMTVAAGEHTHFLCGKDTCNRVGGHTETTKVTFQAWNGTSELPEVVGNYYLMNNVTLSEAWTPVDGVVLCLNGYNITLAYSNDCIIPKTGSTFTLCDCQNGGKITHSNGYRGSGAFVAGGRYFPCVPTVCCVRPGRSTFIIPQRQSLPAMIQYLRYPARKCGKMDGRNLMISSKIPIRPQRINQMPRKKRSCRSFVRA